MFFSLGLFVLIQSSPRDCVPALSSLSLQSRFTGEEVGKSEAFGPSRVLYLKDAASRRLVVRVENGLMKNSEGNLVDTDIADWADGFSYPTSGIFVITKDRSIYISNEQFRGKFHHSSIVSGGSVMSAGSIVVKKGVVTSIGDDSGHYAPSFDHIYLFLKELHDRGVYLGLTHLIFNYSQITPERVQRLKALGIRFSDDAESDKKR